MPDDATIVFVVPVPSTDPGVLAVVRFHILVGVACACGDRHTAHGARTGETSAGAARAHKVMHLNCKQFDAGYLLPIAWSCLPMGKDEDG